MAQAEHVTTAIPAAITGAIAKRHNNGIKAAHAELVAALVGQAPRPLPLFPTPTDLEDRADHLEKVLKAVSIYLTVILDDTAENVSAGLDLRDIEAARSDLVSDVVGTVRNAANDLAGRFA